MITRKLRRAQCSKKHEAAVHQLLIGCKIMAAALIVSHVACGDRGEVEKWKRRGEKWLTDHTHRDATE